MHEQVEVHRYRCLKCGRTFRVYPPGVTHAQSSLRVKGLAVMLYLLGLSYGATSLALEGLGVPLSKTEVYETVQAAAARIPGPKREQVFEGRKTAAKGVDLTSVKCQGQWLHLGLSVDALSGLVLAVEELCAEDAQALKAGTAIHGGCMTSSPRNQAVYPTACPSKQAAKMRFPRPLNGIYSNRRSSSFTR